MAAPTVITVGGARNGFNGRITHATLGRLFVRVDSLVMPFRVNASESSASQAKTFYPHYVSQSSFSMVLLHKGVIERQVVNAWFRRYMEQVTRNRLTAGHMTVSVPGRRFVRKCVPEGVLKYGDSVDERSRLLRSELSFIGASDPASRSEVSRISHSEDWEILKHYPAGSQAGFAAESTVYDVRPTQVRRPGMPSREV